MMRGAQLAVVRKLEGQHIIAIHTQLLGWIAKRLGAYESNKNQRKKEFAILFFKVLQPLLAPLDSRDALAMYVPERYPRRRWSINLLPLAKLT
jgi:cohesin complex subunit SA-1/2